MQFPATPAFRSRRPRASASSTTSRGEAGRRDVAVLDELDRQHPAEAANVADLGPAALPGLEAGPHRLADRGRPLDQAFVLDHVEHGERGRDRNRVADERAADTAGGGRVHDLRPAEHAGEREPHRDRLGDGDQVGLDAEVLDREEPAGPCEAALHLVADEDDAVLVADLAEPFDELARRGDEAALALDGLEDDRGDVLGGDERRERPAQARPAPPPAVGPRNAFGKGTR